MYRFFKFAVALIALIQVAMFCAIADEDIIVSADTYSSTEALMSDGTSNESSDAAEIDVEDELEECISAPVEPAVSEAECVLGDEESRDMTYEMSDMDTVAAASLPSDAESSDNAQDALFFAAEDARPSDETALENKIIPDTRETKSAPAAQTIRLGIGEKYSLSGTGHSGSWQYTSLNKRIATVSAKGVIKGKKRGQTKVVMSDGTTAFEYTVKVFKAPKHIKFPRKSIRLVWDASSGSGEQARLTPKLSSKSSSQIDYYGYDRKVVSVSKDGTVTAVGIGATKVKARTYNRKKAEIKITVVGPADQLKVVAHRGSAHWEENTLAAFRNFPSTGADAVELDVRSCLDGTQVIFHDASFTANGIKYKIEDLTLDQLRKLKPSICTLDEALEVIAATGKDAFLELKETADGARCVRSVRAHGLESRTVFFSFYKKTLKQVYSACPSAVLGLSLKGSAKPYSKSLMNQAKKLHLSFFMANRKLLRKKVVKHWHGKGYKVYVWTVNDKRTMRALDDMGVDGILTDYPEKCVQALNH